MSKRNLGMGGDPSQRMFSTAKELLWRQRVIHPFPCNKDEVLCSLLPGEIQGYIIGSDARDAQWRNLIQCVNLGMSNIIEIDGETGKGFWLGWNGGHPSPVHPDKVMSIYENNPHWRDIVAWYGPAMETHKKLMRYEETLHDFFSRANHPVLVRKYWPELHTFVDFPIGAGQEITSAEIAKRRMVSMPTHEDAVDIIETLAGSTLLEKYDCTAWVGYEVEE